MARPTVAGNAYRWACPMVERMIRDQPAIAVDLLQADTATKHFVALAVRGWETGQGRGEHALSSLSNDLFSRPRSGVLGALWGRNFGKLTLLKRLPGRLLRRRDYDKLADALCDPRKRTALAQHPRLRLSDIEAICVSDQPLAAASVRLAAKIGAELGDYVLAVVRQHRPDLDDGGLATILGELGHAGDLTAWLHAVLRRADLPSPPWPGVDTIEPLRRVAAIDRAGLEFQNCLRGEDWWLSAVLGQRCFYRAGSRDGPALVSIVHDPLLGAWRVECYRGPGNKPLKPAAERRLLAVFAAAGFRYFGDYPRARALDWADAFLTPA